MEDFIDAVSGGALLGVAAGAALFVLRPVRRGLRPVVRTGMKGAVATTAAVSDVTRKGRNAIAELYAEAEAERAESRKAQASKAETPAQEPA